MEEIIKRYQKNKHYESNMMISCISSILKLCERMKNLKSFNFRLLDLNRECYDYFTHFDINSDVTIFPNLKYLTIHIDDKLAQTEVSSFPLCVCSKSNFSIFKEIKIITIYFDHNRCSRFDNNTKRIETKKKKKK